MPPSPCPVYMPHPQANVDEGIQMSGTANEGDANALEAAAADMASAAASLVSLERDIMTMTANGAGGADLATKQAERAEASSLLERRMAAMEAILTSRRKLMEVPLPQEQKVPDIFQPPPVGAHGNGGLVQR